MLQWLRLKISSVSGSCYDMGVQQLTFKTTIMKHLTINTLQNKFRQIDFTTLSVFGVYISSFVIILQFRICMLHRRAHRGATGVHAPHNQLLLFDILRLILNVYLLLSMLSSFTKIVRVVLINTQRYNKSNYKTEPWQWQLVLVEIRVDAAQYYGFNTQLIV